MSAFVTLGGLELRGAIECYDWSDLLADPPKRGGNRVIPGIAGTEVRPRVGHELRAALAVRLRGDMDGTTHVGGTEDEKHGRMYTHLQTLHAVTADTSVQTISLAWSGGSAQDDCQVEECGTPQFVSPWIATLVVDVTLPNGPLL